MSEKLFRQSAYFCFMYMLCCALRYILTEKNCSRARVGLEIHFHDLRVQRYILPEFVCSRRALPMPLSQNLPQIVMLSIFEHTVGYILQNIIFKYVSGRFRIHVVWTDSNLFFKHTLENCLQKFTAKEKWQWWIWGICWKYQQHGTHLKRTTQNSRLFAGQYPPGESVREQFLQSPTRLRKGRSWKPTWKWKKVIWNYWKHFRKLPGTDKKFVKIHKICSVISGDFH